MESHTKEAGHIPHAKQMKVLLKWISNLNIRAKTINSLEENRRINLYNLGLGDKLLGVRATNIRLGMH